MSLHLTADDARRLGAAADALLSPPAAPDPGAWWRDAERHVRALFPRANVMLTFPDAGRLAGASESVDAAALRRCSELAATDPRTGRFCIPDPSTDRWLAYRRAHGVVVWGEALNDDAHRRNGFADWRRTSVFYNDGLLNARLHDLVGITSESSAGEMFVTLGYAARGRSVRGHLEDMALLGLLLPALRAGHHALSRVDRRREAVAALVDRTADALLVVGPAGRTVHRSAALGRLLAQEPERERVLAAMLDAARALGAGPAARDDAAVARRGAAREVVTALARYAVRAAYAPEPLWGVPGAVAVSIEPARTAAPADGGAAAPAALALTPREAEVARLLARRATNAEVAAALGVSWHTARRHTERVLQRLGVRSRRDVAAAMGAGG